MFLELIQYIFKNLCSCGSDSEKEEGKTAQVAPALQNISNRNESHKINRTNRTHARNYNPLKENREDRGVLNMNSEYPWVLRTPKQGKRKERDDKDKRRHDEQRIDTSRHKISPATRATDGQDRPLLHKQKRDQNNIHQQTIIQNRNKIPNQQNEKRRPTVAADNQIERINRFSDRQNERREIISTGNSVKSQNLSKDRKKQDNIYHNPRQHAVSLIDISQSRPKKHIPINQIEADPMDKKKSLSICNLEIQNRRNTSTVSQKKVLTRKRTHNNDETLIDSPSHLSVDEFDGDIRIIQHDHSMICHKLHVISRDKSPYKRINPKEIEIEAKINISNEQFDIMDDRYPKNATKHLPETHLFYQKRSGVYSQSIDDRTSETIVGQIELDIISPKIDTSNPPRLKPKTILDTSETMEGRCSPYINQSVNYSMNKHVSQKSGSLIEIREQLIDQSFDNMDNKNKMNENKVKESEKTFELQTPYSYTFKHELKNNQNRDFATSSNKSEEKNININDSENQKITRSNITDTITSTGEKHKLFFGHLESDTSEIRTTIDKSKENRYSSFFENKIKKRKTVEEEGYSRNVIDDNEQISGDNKENKAIEYKKNVSYNVENKLKNNERENKQILEHTAHTLLKPKTILDTSETMEGRCSPYINQSINYSMNKHVSQKSGSLIEIREQLIDQSFDNMDNKNKMNENKVKESEKTFELQTPYSYTFKHELKNNQNRDFATSSNKSEEKNININDSENQKITRSNVTDTITSTGEKHKLFFGHLESDTSEIRTTIDKSKENRYSSVTEYPNKKRKTVKEERQRRNNIDNNEQISEHIKENKSIENENKVSYDKFKNNENKHKQSLEKVDLSKENNKIQITEINIEKDISKDSEDNSNDSFEKSINKQKDYNKININSFENGIRSDNLSPKANDKEESTKKYNNQFFSEYKRENDNIILQSPSYIDSRKIVDSSILTEKMNEENIHQIMYLSEDKNKTEKNVEQFEKGIHSCTSAEEFDPEIDEIGVSINTTFPQTPINESEALHIEEMLYPKIEEEDTSSDETIISVGKKSGFENPRGFCFLNSVIQVLRSCKKFNTSILKYDCTQVDKSTEDAKKKDFVKNFCKMMIYLKKRKDITKQLNTIQKYFESSRDGDDVHKCFMNILTVIHDVSKRRKTSERNEPRVKTVNSKSFYETFKNEYEGFVFDCFYGEMSHSICCENCGMEFSKKYQLFKCLPVPLPSSSTNIELIRCINSVFESSEIEGENMEPCKCKNGNERIISKSQITYSPEYLFVYLNRGSYFVGGPKNNTFVTCTEVLSFQTASEEVKYKLISTIDHLGSSEGGHYFCRCSYESDKWWLLNDTQVTFLEDSSMENIVSRNTIVFLLKKMKRDRSSKIPHKDPKSNSSVTNSSSNAENQGNVSSDETDISVGEKCGFENPEGYCFLNSVIQVLRSCKKFNTAILKYHKSSKVANSTEDEKKIIFVINFCKIMNDLKERREITVQLNQIQKYFQSSREGDDVHKCFMNILTVIHDVSKELKEKSSSTNDNIKSIYETFKQDYNGFVFDCFYGEMSHSICCENCEMEFSKKYQLFKCLPVPLPNSSTSIELIRCINSVFESSDIEGENMMSCKCENGNERIVSKSQMTYSPEYLFVYLNRGSYFVGGPKNNTFVTCGKELSLQTVFGKVTYKLISTIDHYGSSEGGHYFCRCSYESDEWWLLNDTQVEYLEDPSIEDIITEKTIVFVFRKLKL